MHALRLEARIGIRAADRRRRAGSCSACPAPMPGTWSSYRPSPMAVIGISRASPVADHPRPTVSTRCAFGAQTAKRTPSRSRFAPSVGVQAGAGVVSSECPWDGTIRMASEPAGRPGSLEAGGEIDRGLEPAMVRSARKIAPVPYRSWAAGPWCRLGRPMGVGPHGQADSVRAGSACSPATNHAPYDTRRHTSGEKATAWRSGRPRPSGRGSRPRRRDRDGRRRASSRRAVTACLIAPIGSARHSSVQVVFEHARRRGLAARIEIHRAAVVGIDQAVIPELGALIDIGHAGRGELEHLLARAR